MADKATHALTKAITQLVVLNNNKTLDTLTSSTTGSRADSRGCSVLTSKALTVHGRKSRPRSRNKSTITIYYYFKSVTYPSSSWCIRSCKTLPSLTYSCTFLPSDRRLAKHKTTTSWQVSGGRRAFKRFPPKMVQRFYPISLLLSILNCSRDSGGFFAFVTDFTLLVFDVIPTGSALCNARQASIKCWRSLVPVFLAHLSSDGSSHCPGSLHHYRSTRHWVSRCFFKLLSESIPCVYFLRYKTKTVLHHCTREKNKRKDR